MKKIISAICLTSIVSVFLLFLGLAVLPKQSLAAFANCWVDPHKCTNNTCCKTDTGKTKDGYCTKCTGKLDEIVCGKVTCNGATSQCCPSGCKPKGSSCGSGACKDTSWSPDPATICDTESITQTSNCGKNRTVKGKKTCAPGACMEIKVYKKNADGSVGTSALTATQLANLSLGDTLRLTIKASLTNLQARFRVQFNGTPMTLPGPIVWPDSPNQRPRQGFTDPTTKFISYYDFIATRSGTYIFEGFVTTKP